MNIVDTRFGLKTDVSVSFSRYGSGELRLDLEEAESQEPWLTATVAVGAPGAIPKDCIAVKDYSENEGVANLLIANGLIESTPVASIKSGFVVVKVYRLTPIATALVQE
jgi:hypothetical protein